MAGGLARFLLGFDYFVFFDTYGVEIPYPTSRLRPHFEWVNGKWASKKRV